MKRLLSIYISISQNQRKCVWYNFVRWRGDLVLLDKNYFFTFQFRWQLSSLNLKTNPTIFRYLILKVVKHSLKFHILVSISKYRKPFQKFLHITPNLIVVAWNNYTQGNINWVKFSQNMVNSLLLSLLHWKIKEQYSLGKIF